MSYRSSKTTTSQTPKISNRSTVKSTYNQEKQQYYSFLGISNPFPPVSREQNKPGGSLAVTLPPLTSSFRKTSYHPTSEKRRVSTSSTPYETGHFLRKPSEETKKMLTELDKDATTSQKVEGVDAEATITELPERTPEPEILHDFPELRSGVDSKPERMRRHSSYAPRYCWCTRCQIMYRMYKENDNNLEGWGNYPCLHF